MNDHFLAIVGAFGTATAAIVAGIAVFVSARYQLKTSAAPRGLRPAALHREGANGAGSDTLTGPARALTPADCLLTPPGVASCLDAAGTIYSVNADQNALFCAYHMSASVSDDSIALEGAPAGSVVHAVAEEGIATKDIAKALGAALDVPASSAIMRERLGWEPTPQRARRPTPARRSIRPRATRPTQLHANRQVEVSERRQSGEPWHGAPVR